MKKVIVILLCCLAGCVSALAQLPSDAVFQKYANSEGIQATVISGFMLKPFVENLTQNLKADEKQIISKSLKNVKNLAMLQASSKAPKMMKTLTNEATKLQKNAKYSEIFSQKQQQGSLRVVGLKSNGVYTEVLGFGYSNSEAMLVSAQGSFTDEMVNSLLKQFANGGLK